MALKLGNKCEIFILKDGKTKWATTHPNREPGKLDRYLDDLNRVFIVGRPSARMTITRRDIPQTDQ
jgi:hypothetical protein